MVIKHIFQPPESSLCGQCCVSMVVNKPLPEVIAVFKKKGATTAKEVSKVLTQFGFIVPDKLSVIRKYTQIPPLCLMKLKYTGRNKWHWVVKDRDTIQDPAHGTYAANCDVSDLGGRFTSFLEIQLKA